VNARAAKSEWSASKALLFATVVCGFYWVLTIAGSLGPQVQLSIPRVSFAIGSKFVLVMLAALIPAIASFTLFAEVRDSFKRWKAPWFVYLLALGVGIGLPFMSYFGSHYPNFPWTDSSRVTLVRVLFLNLLLSPLWEETIWRACFQKKMTSFISKPKAVLSSSLAWTVWHGGFMVYLYSEGVPTKVFVLLPPLYFLLGIIIGTVFEMSAQSLWPCVFLPAGFDAATTVYYSTYDRVSEVSSYAAELIVTAIVAAVLCAILLRRRDTSQIRETDAARV
jgi:membrane protease YdiL (CAAX protease family)